MKNHSSNNLQEELRSAGASTLEVAELTDIADSLKRLKTTKDLPSKSFLQTQHQSKLRMLIPLGVASLTGLALGMVLVILSQTVLPGSLLYPVQKLSDNVGITINPAYRGTVMMKRAQEVKQLIAEHANSNLVIATLTDYKAEALAYKSASTNYEAFEYCKANLKQAAAMAPNSDRQAINNTLLSLKNV